MPHFIIVHAPLLHERRCRGTTHTSNPARKAPRTCKATILVIPHTWQIFGLSNNKCSACFLLKMLSMYTHLLPRKLLLFRNLRSNTTAFASLIGWFYYIVFTTRLMFHVKRYKRCKANVNPEYHKDNESKP